MKTLNKTATATFNKCVKLAEQQNGYCIIDNTNNSFMPVVVEIIERDSEEKATKVSIAHYYEQNGDLMADPEMCFAIINGFIVPYFYKTDCNGVWQESVIYDGVSAKKLYPYMQADHSNFANMWFMNIKRQQRI